MPIIHIILDGNSAALQKSWKMLVGIYQNDAEVWVHVGKEIVDANCSATKDYSKSARCTTYRLGTVLDRPQTAGAERDVVVQMGMAVALSLE